MNHYTARGGFDKVGRERLSMNAKRFYLVSALAALTFMLSGCPATPSTPTPGAVAAYGQGKAYYDQDDHSQAISEYSRAIELQPDYAEAYIGRGEAYQAQCDWSKAKADYTQAIAVLDEAIRRNPKDAEAYYQRGRAYQHLTDRDRAIADFTQAIALQPDYAEAYFGRGDISHRVSPGSDLNQAVADYSRAIELRPDYVEAYKARGWAYEWLNDLTQANDDYKQALAIYDRVIELRPEDAQAYYRRGWVHRDLGEIDQAIADFGRAIELAPGFLSAYRSRAEAYWEKQDLDRSVADRIEFERLASVSSPRCRPDPGAWLDTWAPIAEAYMERGLKYADGNVRDRPIADFKKVLELALDQRLRQKAESELQKLGVK
jgi:tetratricopeptide (TPR) repeat protein